MKRFSIKEYLKNPDRKVVTYDGRDVRIICVNRIDKDYPVVALIRKKNGESVESFTADGKYINNKIYNHDLFFALEKKWGWVNIYKIAPGDIQLSDIYNSKEDAEAMAKSYDDYVDTIKIEWKE